LAEGGPVSAGTPYIVGEKGPELFMPSSAGTIIPNIDRPNIFGLESKGGGEVNNNYSISIHAVDAASFAELVERNPEVIVSQVTGAADSGHGGLRQSMRDIIR
jgi:phage-related minor tail protein